MKSFTTNSHRDGSVNAIDFARATIARRLIADRTAAGLTQQQLADAAGVRQETISRIESGKHTVTPAVMDKLDRVLSPRPARPTLRPAKRRQRV